jgi:hypothetical protein
MEEIEGCCIFICVADNFEHLILLPFSIEVLSQIVNLGCMKIFDVNDT